MSTPVTRPAFSRWAVPVLYLGVSFLFFGLPVLLAARSPYIGFGPDPEIFIWSFAWWAHALSHGVNPLHSNAIWVPEGFNLAFSATGQGLAALFIPITLVAGPTAAYNIAAVVLPALAAWTAYLLCRRLTARTWPSFVGGYLFGFSSYILGQEEGHLHMSGIFLLPLGALLVVRGLDGSLPTRAIAVRLGAVLGTQIWISTEVFVSASLAIAVALAVAALTMPGMRVRVRAALPGIVGAGVIGVILGSPLLYLALPAAEAGSVNLPSNYPTDVLNLVVPTGLTFLGGSWAGSAVHYTAGNVEAVGYLGIPAVGMIVAFLVARRGTELGRFLLVVLAAALLLSYGTSLHVAGHGILWLPGSALSYVAPFDNVLPSRLSIYVALVGAVVVALWASSTRSRALRIALPVCAFVTLAPMLGHGYWSTTPPRPAFFASPLLDRCVPSGERILTIPYNNHGDALLWQAESDFRFNLAEGYVTVKWPASYVRAGEPFAQLESGRSAPTVAIGAVVRFARSKGVDAIVVRDGPARGWSTALASVIRPVRAGGVELFPLTARGSAGGAGCSGQ